MLLLCPGLLGAASDSAPPTPALPSVTYMEQLSRLDFENRRVCYSIALEGDVLWADAGQGRIVLRDDSGAAELDIDMGGARIQPGHKARVTGYGLVARRGAGFRLGVKGPVVDNNGIHSMIEKSGQVYLGQGIHPLRLEWFNGVEVLGLQVEYEAPGATRMPIPDSTLFHNADVAASERANSLQNGLHFRCFEGDWPALPDFSLLTPVKSGVTKNIDSAVRTREEHAGIQFDGFFEAPRAGLYVFYLQSDDGSRLWVGGPSMRIESLGPCEFPQPRPVTGGQSLERAEGFWARAEGRVNWQRQSASGVQLELQTGGSRLRVEIPGEPPLPSHSSLSNCWLRVDGFCQGARAVDGQIIAEVLLTPGGPMIQSIPAPVQPVLPAGSTNGSLPVFKTAGEVHRLSRTEALRGYPVCLRGVVTCVLPERQAFTIQDATRGIYVVGSAVNLPFPPQVGEYLLVEGATDPSLFAPIVNATNIATLGAGVMPEPMHTTWDQLANGSLDAQHVEIEGIVTGTHTNGVTLLTRDGILKIELRLAGHPGAGDAGDTAKYHNALVRIRGCLFAAWDYKTHRIEEGPLRVYNASVNVVEPAPDDLFSIPKKSVAELLLFDPRGGVCQRVKVAGQITHARGAECFLMDGTNGLRFFMNPPEKPVPGNLVEVAGFPIVSGGSSPVLREAILRKTGSAPLPAPLILPADDPVRADYDARYVRTRATLTGLRRSQSDSVLELRSGARAFTARLEAAAVPAWTAPVGSVLELTGVYTAVSGPRTGGGEIATFELLLHSPNAIVVLAKPPWWTLRRLLLIVGALTGLLAVTTLWITQLRRQVEERTSELGAQIQARQRVERQRELEQERARVARDLHDELGSGLTEIGMLADRVRPSAAVSEETRNARLHQIGDKTRQLVSALDEIVWAMNPRHDSLASLVSYLSLHADRFLGLAGIAWRLDAPAPLPDRPVDSHTRHQLFLVFKEALNNIVSHSRATEVRVVVRVDNERLLLSVEDNGHGLTGGEQLETGDGIINMRTRMEKLGGRFEVASESGTVLRFQAPLKSL